MYCDRNAVPSRHISARATREAMDMIFTLADLTGPDAPEPIRHSLAILAGSLGDPDVDVIRAGMVGYADGDPNPDLIAWT